MATDERNEKVGNAMKKLNVLVSALLWAMTATMAAGQESPEAAIIPVKTLSGDSFNRLANLLGVFKVEYRADEKLRTILVYGSKEKVEQIRRVVAELDRPGSEAAIGRNIELTLSYLRCSTKPPAANQPPLPPDMEAVAKQLRAATQYKDIQLWDTIPLRLQEGKDTDQSMRLPTAIIPEAPGAFATSQIRIRPEAVSTRDTGRYVRFDFLKIGFRIPYLVSRNPPPAAQYNFMEVGLNTAGDFKEGQKSVIGKISGPDDEAIFVVVSLKVLD
jgi:hypothetical protein